MLVLVLLSDWGYLQIKSQELFDEWVSKLRHHRLYRQNEIAMYPNEKSFYYPHYSSPKSPNSPSLAKSASLRKVNISITQHTVNEKCVVPKCFPLSFCLWLSVTYMDAKNLTVDLILNKT